MPPAINIDERLDAIAVATLEIAQERGPKGVTIRSVAARLGGSTTLITKYLPSRGALIANAYRYMSALWSSDRAAALDQRTGLDQLRALAAWSLNTRGYDDAIRKLWIEALATGQTSIEGTNLTHEHARAQHDRIHAVINIALPADAGWLADTLFLAFRGYYLSTIEDPEQWPPHRAAAAIKQLLDLVETNRAATKPTRSRAPRR